MKDVAAQESNGSRVKAVRKKRKITGPRGDVVLPEGLTLSTNERLVFEAVREIRERNYRPGRSISVCHVRQFIGLSVTTYRIEQTLMKLAAFGVIEPVRRKVGTMDDGHELRPDGHEERILAHEARVAVEDVSWRPYKGKGGR